MDGLLIPPGMGRAVTCENNSGLGAQACTDYGNTAHPLGSIAAPPGCGEHFRLHRRQSGVSAQARAEIGAGDSVSRRAGHGQRDPLPVAGQRKPPFWGPSTGASGAQRPGAGKRPPLDFLKKRSTPIKNSMTTSGRLRGRIANVGNKN
jgi:hypothetical protein